MLVDASPEGESPSERGHWECFLGHPPVIFLECVK
jgi:hypothetical protein